MLKIILSTDRGQLSHPTLAGLAEYRKRLSRTCSFTWQLGCPVRVTDEPAGQDPQVARIRLDRQGLAMTSPELAEHFQRWMLAGCSKVGVELGRISHGQPSIGQPSDSGPMDQSETVELSRELVLSLSPLALSADLAALLAAEQIYRAFRILENQPYHK